MSTMTETLPVKIEDSPIDESSPPAEPTLFDIRHRITVEEYHRMAEAEVFGPAARVELLQGVVVDKMTKLPPHVIATDLVDEKLHQVVPLGFFASMGNPILIDADDSEPEPDAMVIRGAIRDYTGRRRTPADAALVIEVADSSYGRDRGVKRRIYAGARVPIYWLLDLIRRRLEVHTEPIGEGDAAAFRKTELYGPDDEVPLVLDGREVARFKVAEILP